MLLLALPTLSLHWDLNLTSSCRTMERGVQGTPRL